MQVNKFVTMTVGLVVGVLLIAGVVAPVIANVSSSDSGSGETYTNTGDGDRFSKPNASTSLTYTASNDAPYCTFLTSDSLIDMEPQEIMEVGPVYGVYIDGLSSGDTNEFTLSGSTLSYTLDGGDTETTVPGVLLYSDAEGDYLCTIYYSDGTYENTGTSYALGSTPVVCWGGKVITVDDTPVMCMYTISGTVSDNSVNVWGFDQSDNPVELTSEGPAEFTIEDNQITNISFGVSGQEISLDIDALSGEYDRFMMYLPITVESSSGSSVSPTLVTILSVIPLVLTVGLVIGAIGFLRLKQ